MVYRGGKLDVKFRVESPSREVMYDRLIFSNIDDSSGAMLSTIVKKGTTFIVQKPGVYIFCLDNRMARWVAARRNDARHPAMWQLRCSQATRRRLR